MRKTSVPSSVSSLLCLLSAFSASSAVDLFAGGAEPAQRPLAPGQVTQVGGFLGERLRANADALRKSDVDRYVAMAEERKYRDWPPIGEQTGKWLEAAIEASDASGDAELRQKAKDVLRRLVAAQEPGGYLGVTDPALRTDRRPLRGMDPYELTFTLDALLAAWQRWGDADALAAAKKLGDFLVEKVAPGKAEFFPVPRETTMAGRPEAFGLEATLLAGPMARLGRLAGEKKYLDWSQWVVGSIDRWSGCDALSSLDKVAAGSMRLPEILPSVDAHALHLNLLALLDLYQATGDEGLLRKARGAWRDIVTWRTYETGGVGVGGRYQGDDFLPNTGEAAETCATASWLLLNQRLLELTGEPDFADVAERLLWNHLPAAQTPDGDGWRRFTPLAGWKPEGCFTGPDCCSSAGPLILARVAGLIYAQTPDGVAVNQYVPSAARFQLASGTEVALRLVTDYPAGEKVAVEVSPARPERFVLRLRLPAWCEKPALAVNGQPAAQDLEPRTYAAVDREWKQGDRVDLTLPMDARWVPGTHGNEGLYAIERGPVVYALDSVWCDEATRRAVVRDAAGDPFPGLSGVVLDPDEPAAGLQPVATPAGALGPAYRVRIALPGNQRALATLLPFANVGTCSPSKSRRRDAYAVWLPEATSGRFRTVDLRAAANVGSSSGRGLFASLAHPDETFPFARYGLYSVRDVPFEVIDPAANGGRNLLILQGGPPGAVATSYPARVALPVGFRCRALHVLGCVGGWAYPADRDRRPALTLLIRYDDAPTQEVRWTNGDQLADYASRENVPGSAAALELGGRQLRTLRIRTNPHSPVTRIEIIDSGSPVAPVFAAVTAELPEE